MPETSTEHGPGSLRRSLDRLIYGTLCLIAWFFSLLPDKVAGWFAKGLAIFVFDVLRLRRRLVMKNIINAAPSLYGTPQSSEALQQLARKSYENFALTIIEMFASRYRDPVPNVSLVNREHIDRSLAPGKGAVILCGHLGNWETMGAGCTRLISPAHVVVKKVGTGAVTRFVEDTRKRVGFLSIERRKRGDGTRNIVLALKANEIIGFVMDQARNDLRLPFLGREAKTNGSLAKLWLKYRFPIVPSYIVRKAPFKHDLHFFEPLDLSEFETLFDSGKATEEELLLPLTKRFNEGLEAMVRRNPEQYFWLHNRWKS